MKFLHCKHFTARSNITLTIIITIIISIIITSILATTTIVKKNNFKAYFVSALIFAATANFIKLSTFKNKIVRIFEKIPFLVQVWFWYRRQFLQTFSAHCEYMHLILPVYTNQLYSKLVLWRNSVGFHVIPTVTVWLKLQCS